jgi:hypothetical protein
MYRLKSNHFPAHTQPPTRPTAAARDHHRQLPFSFPPHICLSVATSARMYRLKSNHFPHAHHRLPGWPPQASTTTDDVLVSAAHLPERGHIGADVPAGGEPLSARTQSPTWPAAAGWDDHHRR